jgi:choline dehydrogenase-like flavoprotein
MRRERPIQSLCYACREYNDLENPYTQAKPFNWIRIRALGGRSLSWGRQSYRMSDLDFKAASHDGYIDRFTREPREVRARLVVLCASTLESTRRLLNSKLYNSSGVLGHLCDGPHLWRWRGG